MSQSAPERATALSTLLSGTHGRDRREERGIEKIDLQRARRYGMKEAAHNGRHKYTYGGIVFIYDQMRNREVTSFPSKDVSLRTSGTQVAQPVLLDKKTQYEHPAEVQQHSKKHAEMMANLGAWTSHSVLVIDMSGSMRRDDVNGGRCRSDGVWMALARDYVGRELEKKTRSCTDLISVVVMRDRGEVVMRAEPTDWVLYNTLVDLREWDKIRPSGPGNTILTSNYLPALDLAEQLLLQNTEGSCALSLLFFSDGRPSDRGDFAARMGKIASKFGRRLSVTCIGMAEEGEDFSTLLSMVDEAKAYGAVATFGKPSLDADSLSNIITSLASSLTTTKTEMTELATGKSKTVRMDVRREKVGTPDDTFVTDEWYIYRNESLKSFWDWSYKLDDFRMVVETRCMKCWAFVAPSRLAFTCPRCKIATYCSAKCFSLASPDDHGGPDECARYRSEYESGRMVRKDGSTLPSFSVAMRKTVFSEGAERMVHKFRFLDDKSNSFIGPKMVAKESRFVEATTTYQHRFNYHREFMRTQAIASEMAVKFNEAIDALAGHFGPRSVKLVATLPRINFLTPMIVETMDPELGAFAILIEPMLDVTKYEKFNNNMGFVKGQKRQGQDLEDSLANEMASLQLCAGANADAVKGNGDGLGAIEEGSEEEDEDDEEGDLLKSGPSKPDANTASFNLEDEEFPHAFSHFSYEMSKGRLMVVDLQGVFTVRPDGTRVYELTDPVIHKKQQKRFRKWTFGRTDRGKKGMHAFFQTHKCSDVCKALGLKEGMLPQGRRTSKRPT